MRVGLFVRVDVNSKSRLMGYLLLVIKQNDLNLDEFLSLEDADGEALTTEKYRAKE